MFSVTKVIWPDRRVAMRDSHRLSIEQITGGGVSWWYLFDDAGKIVMSAHGDDRKAIQEMYAKLAEMKRKAKQA
jgi:hypothetical protein